MLATSSYGLRIAQEKPYQSRPGQDDVLMGNDRGMKMKMLEDQAEYYDYLDDEVWVYLYRFNMVLFWHQFLQRDEHITLELILN